MTTLGYQGSYNHFFFFFKSLYRQLSMLMVIVQCYTYRCQSKFTFLSLAKIPVAPVTICLLRFLSVPDGAARVQLLTVTDCSPAGRRKVCEARESSSGQMGNHAITVQNCNTVQSSQPTFDTVFRMVVTSFSEILWIIIWIIKQGLQGCQVQRLKLALEKRKKKEKKRIKKEKAESGYQYCSSYLLIQNCTQTSGSSFKGGNPLFIYTPNWFLYSRQILSVFGIKYMYIKANSKNKHKSFCFNFSFFAE